MELERLPDLISYGGLCGVENVFVHQSWIDLEEGERSNSVSNLMGIGGGGYGGSGCGNGRGGGGRDGGGYGGEIECTRRRSARSSEEIRRRPEIHLRLNLKLDAKELLSLRSLVDSVMKSIESCTDFGSFYEDSIDRSESSMQEEGYGSLCEDDHFMCIARNS
ncbi:hypothetical protein QYF36_022540 [Acer negundo]|nr:hypothetical protein QYF36_022540 [Acer negundo]